MNREGQNRIHDVLGLAERALEGQLTDEELKRLESAVLSDVESARAYARYVSQHASLQLYGDEVDGLSTLRSIRGRRGPEPPAGDQIRAPLSGWRISFAAACILAVVCILISWRFVGRPIAVLIDAKNCKWVSGSLPTEEGATLTSGRLRLAEGLATIQFSSGAVVKLEAPTDFELMTPMRCMVHSGQVVADVPTQAHGFTIETPSTVVTDWGTEFGVTVGQDRSSFVRVFNGRVDTLHRATGKTEVMYADSSIRFDHDSYHSFDSQEQSITNNRIGSELDRSRDWLMISTAIGRGGDAFVQPQDIPEDRRSDTLLLVKKPVAWMPEWERRAYLAFDLEAIGSRRIAEVELRLQFAPTGFGYAALTPDSIFRVYGLIDSHEDFWNDRELVWSNAPACKEMGSPLDFDKVVEVGSFTVQQGDQQATVTISSAELTDFMNRDTNRLITLIIVRETVGKGSSDLVHGIAGRRHPSLSPPTLRILAAEDSQQQAGSSQNK